MAQSVKDVFIKSSLQEHKEPAEEEAERMQKPKELKDPRKQGPLNQQHCRSHPGQRAEVHI